jgi:hypothetical protein
MTPKEKAKELTEKFNNINNAIFRLLRKPVINSISKQCALIAVDELIRVFDEDFDDYRSYYNYHTADEYWQEVKNEIEKL